MPDKPDGVELYRRMLLIRHFEERVDELYRAAKMPGLAHLYIGEEAVAVGVCAALRDDDYITSTHRGHGHCRGKGASVHVADQERGNLGANAIVGGSAGIATGAAMSASRRGSDQVAVCFFGDGALGQGLVYEAMNMASLWQLPVIYVCENNLYNEYTHYLETTAGELTARPRAFGIETAEVDGQDVLAVYEAAAAAVERARGGQGPSFLLCHTYRYRGHHVGDVDRSYYRSREEEDSWLRDRDPIALLGARLTQSGATRPDELEALDEEVRTEVAAGVAFGLEAPFPDPSEVTEDVYA